MDMLKQEEDRFFATIEHGMAILEAELTAMARRRRLQRRDGLQAARHLRLPARPDRRRLPRARRDRRRRRLRRRDGAPEGTGARRRQVQDGGQPGIRRPGDHLPRLRHAGSQGQGAGAVQGRRRGQRAERRRPRRRRARRHAVLRRVRRPGRRSRRAAVGAWHLRRRGHAEDPGHRLRPPRRRQDRHAHGRQRRHRQGRRAGPRAHHAQPLGHAPDAQGAARSARRPRAAEGLAGRSGQDALRLRAQPADDRRGNPPRREHRQCRDPRQHRHRNAA